MNERIRRLKKHNYRVAALIFRSDKGLMLATPGLVLGAKTCQIHG